MGDHTVSLKSDGQDMGIKTMKLYQHYERVDNELRALGICACDPVTAEQLAPFDNLHYHGCAAVQEAIQSIPLTSEHHILDIGSGLGGPARYISTTIGARVCALELQEDSHRKAAEYTKRCGLDNKVQHVCGDILELDVNTLGDGQHSFDVVTAWLVFLHISNKQLLLSQCVAALRPHPSGVLYFEDFYMLRPFTPAEYHSLEKDVFASDLPTRDQYMTLLRKAGFVDIEWVDMTRSWRGFVSTRLAAHQAAKQRFIAVHGKGVYNSQLFFYEKVNTLFQDGNLGGVRVTARLPGTH